MAELVDLFASLLGDTSVCSSYTDVFTSDKWRTRVANLLFALGKTADIVADWVVVLQLLDGVFSQRKDTKHALVVAIGCAVLGSVIELYAVYLKVQKHRRTKEGAVRTLEMVRLNRELAWPRFLWWRSTSSRPSAAGRAGTSATRAWDANPHA